MATSAQKQREELLARVTIGEMTRERAEAEAKRLDLTPFARSPNPLEFDPVKQSQWTFPMALTWIAYRSFDEVRGVWDSYCAECWDWHWRSWSNGPHGQAHEGWVIEQQRCPTVRIVEMMAIVDDGEDEVRPLVMPMRNAKAALWNALEKSTLQATGIAKHSGLRVAINPDEWRALKSNDSDNRDEVGREGVHMEYAEPMVPAKIVRQLWGPLRQQQRLTELVHPEGNGYLPVYCAAQWIASEGGKIEIDPEDETLWRDAFERLLGAIASEKAQVTGMRAGMRERVPGFHFAGCIVEYPYSRSTMDLVTEGSMFLRSYPYVDDTQWRSGFDDALVNPIGESWTQLMVEKGDVRSCWPFSSQALPKTGAPGRPSSMYLVLAELEKIGSEGSLEPSIRKQAAVLSGWLARQHPDQPPLTLKTISNKIGSRFRALNSARN